MRVTDIRRDSDQAAAWITARVTWEDSERRPTRLYFATAKDYASRLSLRAEPFALACLMPALKHGERRLAVEAGACPLFVDGVRTNLDIFARWYGPRWGSIDLEVAPNGLFHKRPGPRAGMLLSGGVDSLATLRRNMVTVPNSHPARVRDCILVNHQGALGAAASPDDGTIGAETTEPFDGRLARLRRVGQEADAETIPLHTNLTSLDADPAFWLQQFHGAAMAAVSHALSTNLGMMTFASADIPLMRPSGSHPLTDPNWSNAALRILHDTLRFTRLEKTRLVADWPTGLGTLRVCGSAANGHLNCGACETCLRTMLMLLTLGRLQGAPFPQQDLGATDVEAIAVTQARQARQYRDIIAGLDELGRDDLTRPLAKALRHFQVSESLKRFDSRLCGGLLQRGVRALRRHRAPA